MDGKNKKTLNKRVKSGEMSVGTSDATHAEGVDGKNEVEVSH